MSIKEELVNAIKDKVIERALSCKNQYRKVKGKWCNRTQFNEDRYNLGAIEKLQEELKWLDELLEFIGML